MRSPVMFYTMPISPPCRAVWMTLKTLSVPHVCKEVDLLKGEHKAPEFADINPMQQIPVVVDNGYKLWESTAIMVYLCETFGGPSCHLYPSAPDLRAKVNHVLFQNLGVQKTMSDWLYPQVFQQPPKTPPPQTRAKLDETLKTLNDIFLSSSAFIAGDVLTVADFAVVATLTMLELKNFDFAPYNNVTRWIARVKQVVPDYYTCSQALPAFKHMMAARAE